MTSDHRQDGLHVRWEQESDYIAIDALHTAAFGRDAEAKLVRDLRHACPDACGSVVTPPTGPAEEPIAGHVFFSPVRVDDGPSPGAMGLAPMAVLPEMQRRGIGSALLTTSLDQMQTRGARWVVLVGDPAFYRRAGFRPGVEFGLRCEFDVPDAVFLVRELLPGALRGIGGKVFYHPLFQGLD